MLPTGNRNIPQIAAFGEFMLRLHSSCLRRFLQTSAYEAYYAGAEANVSVLLARLGIPVSYITRVPDNDLVKAGVEQLRGHGVDTAHISYGGDRLALYFTEQGNGIRSTRVIYDRAGTAYASLQPEVIDWRKALEGMTWFHWSGKAEVEQFIIIQQPYPAFAISERSIQNLKFKLDLHVHYRRPSRPEYECHGMEPGSSAAGTRYSRKRKRPHR